MIILETKRLRLRHLSPDIDAEFILELLNGPSFIRYIGDKGVRDLNAARRYMIDGPVNSYDAHGFGLYLVELKRNAAPIGICGVLNRLAGGPISQQELGEQLGIDRTTMVELIDELERQGAVVRRRNAADRRSYALSLTPRGRTVQKRAAKAFDDAADEFFGALKPAERDDLAGMLRRLIVKADASLAPSKGGRSPSADRQHKKSSA